MLAPHAKLNVGLRGFTATELADGRYLFSGGMALADMKCAGSGDGGCAIPPTPKAQLFDPRRNAVTWTGSMSTGLVQQRTALLNDGRIFVVMGAGGDASMEIFDPKTGRFEGLGSGMLPKGTEIPTVAVLRDGRVLLAGGHNESGTGLPFTIFDPSTNSVAVLPGLPTLWKDGAASVLPDGRVLLTGGIGTIDGALTGLEPLREAWLFDPITATLLPTGNVTIGRGGARQVPLADGRVVLVGGETDPSNPTCGALPPEIYDPASGTFTLATGEQSNSQATPLALADGRVLLIGGSKPGDCGSLSRDVDVYDPDTNTVGVLAANVLPSSLIEYVLPLPDGSALLLSPYAGVAYVLTVK